MTAMRATLPLLSRIPFPSIRRGALEVLQVNLGYRCNQQCFHCHVNASPKRREQMDAETVEAVLDFLARTPVRLLDLTGGAPELNPHFRDLVARARAMGVAVVDRCNLTILEEPGQEDLAAFLAAHGVRVVASLPCYLEENVNAQRGDGVFDASIRGLRRLNDLGYGEPDGDLELELVYNPQGPSLPPSQVCLEADYRRELQARYRVRFTRLLTLANMPIQRFGSTLLSRGEFDGYMDTLQAAHRDENLAHVMCRTLVSVDWRGYLYDCDFNQMLDLPLAGDGAGCTSARWTAAIWWTGPSRWRATAMAAPPAREAAAGARWAERRHPGRESQAERTHRERCGGDGPRRAGRASRCASSGLPHSVAGRDQGPSSGRVPRVALRRIPGVAPAGPPNEMNTRLSIVVPVLNEAGGIERCLMALATLRAAGHEVVVVDGGSRDATAALARPLCDHLLVTAPGRGRQLAAGARRASGDVVVLLHADTELPPAADAAIAAAMADGFLWGRFDVRLDGRHRLLRLVERMMGLRSRLTGIATGDQAVFVRRAVLEAAGGVPEQPLMEDIELSRRLRAQGPPACLRATVWTSSRRWEEEGVLRTIATMWLLRLAYWAGVPAARLCRLYYPAAGGGQGPRSGEDRPQDLR